MQEDVERRSIAITITEGKLTAKVLAKALAAALRKMQQAHKKRTNPAGQTECKKADESQLQYQQHSA